MDAPLTAAALKARRQTKNSWTNLNIVRKIYFSYVRYICQGRDVIQMKLNEIIAENLKKLRMERALSLGRLAELSGSAK
jgi:hypothetical protein